MQAVAPFQEAIDIIKEEGGEICKLCYQCGTCTATCLDVWRSLRRAIVELGIGGIPDPLRISAKNISGVGNPQGEDRESRTNWARDLGIKTYTKGTEILYFPCCYNSYDPRSEQVAKATASILKAAEVDFGILGNEQSCCGESIRKAGHESLFQSLAESNISLLNEAGVTRIITTSPHCYHTFKSEYPELGGNFEVVHFCQYLAELIKEGRLKLTKELNKKVTYHDSCYLGRHNDIYDEPREILNSIPGLELVEMFNHHDNSLCCGGGGGRIWEETKKGERFSDQRVQQALDVEAEILAVACPYCMAMLEDSVLTMDKGEVIEVKGIAELVAEAL